MPFNIGDRVLANIFGKKISVGVIKFTDNDGLYAVEFQKFSSGHTCEGHCQPSSGWWCGEDELTLDAPYEPLSKQELIIRKIKYLQDKFDNRKLNYV